MIIPNLWIIPNIRNWGWGGWGSLQRRYLFNGSTWYILRDASDSANLTATTSQLFSCWIQQNADGTAASNSLPFFWLPYIYAHIRNSTNDLTLRFADGWGAKTSSYTLWAWFRSEIFVIGCLENNWGWVYTTKLYVNWILRDSDVWAAPPTTLQSASPRFWSNNSSGWFFSWYWRKPRIYTGTITDADALAMYLGWSPATATPYFWRWPTSSESWTTVPDSTGNSRTGSIVWWVTRVYRP